ncbi:hypothetical protein [Citrobacter freundii]|uniref:hypothetical protein n=1 Tax=Citrobacter freundii TaxID=546 RepID=UPI00397CE3F1
MKALNKQAQAIISDIRLKHGSGDAYAPIIRWDEFEVITGALEDAEKRIEEGIFRANREHHRGFMMACNHLKEHANIHYADAAEMEIAALRQRIAELEANKCKPVMFIDGDISPADADKLAAVIREFNEETETPAARMARIIRENPHPTNMCDMPAAGIGVKGE